MSSSSVNDKTHRFITDILKINVELITLTCHTIAMFTKLSLLFNAGFIALSLTLSGTAFADSAEKCSELTAAEEQLLLEIRSSLETADHAELFSLLTGDIGAAEEAELNDAISEKLIKQITEVRAEIKTLGCE